MATQDVSLETIIRRYKTHIDFFIAPFIHDENFKYFTENNQNFDAFNYDFKAAFMRSFGLGDSIQAKAYQCLKDKYKDLVITKNFAGLEKFFAEYPKIANFILSNEGTLIQFIERYEDICANSVYRREKLNEIRNTLQHHFHLSSTNDIERLVSKVGMQFQQIELHMPFEDYKKNLDEMMHNYVKSLKPHTAAISSVLLPSPQPQKRVMTNILDLEQQSQKQKELVL